MEKTIIILQGLLDLSGISLFLSGIIVEIEWLWILGGSIMLLDDIYEMITGILNPLFPVFLGVVFAYIISPWYLGVFWSIAAFKVLGIPSSLIKIFSPSKVLEKVVGADTQ